MPQLTRWAIKTAIVYLVFGPITGVLYWANVQWAFAPVFAALSPTYLHILVVGWLT